MDEVTRLFQDKNDEKALKLLFDITGDEIAKIALKCKKEQELSLTHFTIAMEMYDDIISYLYKKYNL